MKELLILISPVFWSLKNDLLSFNRSFYKKTLFHIVSSLIFIFIVTKLLSIGMAKLQNLSGEIFHLIMIKGYSLIFIILFFTQIINGFIMSLNKFYQSRELETLIISPVNRTSLFFSRLFETHLKTSWMLIIFGIPLLLSLGIILKAPFVYYFFSLFFFAVFFVIPVNIGIAMTIMLSGIFHIKKLKKVLFSAGLIAIIVIVTVLRLFKPERFVSPELFANLKLFIVELKTPSFILLPSRWLSESIFNFINRNYTDTFIFIALLLLTAYLTVVLLILIFKKYHYRGWLMLQKEGSSQMSEMSHSYIISRLAENVIKSKAVHWLLSLLGKHYTTLFKKDLLYQIKDTNNFNQLLILLSLIIVYLFSIASLPLNWVEYALKLKYMISFIDLGLILIIIAALCSKLVYPAIVSEGRSMWIIKTSPITSKKYIWIKFLFLLIPIFLLGQLLTVFSSVFIDIGGEFFAFKIMTTALLCFSLVSMSISFSLLDLKKSLKEGDNKEIKTGNVVYMVISIFFIIFSLAIGIIPVYLYFLKESSNIEFTKQAWLMIGSLISLLFLINILVTAFSIHLSIKRFDSIQLS